MRQKTVRFYDDAPDDMSAVQILDEYRKYGFNSAREMVIAAVNNFVQGSNISSLGVNSKDIDELAERIAEKMINMNMTISNCVAYSEENRTINSTDNDKNYQKALSFMDSL